MFIPLPLLLPVAVPGFPVHPSRLGLDANRVDEILCNSKPLPNLNRLPHQALSSVFSLARIGESQALSAEEGGASQVEDTDTTSTGFFTIRARTHEPGPPPSI